MDNDWGWHENARGTSNKGFGRSSQMIMQWHHFTVAYDKTLTIWILPLSHRIPSHPWLQTHVKGGSGFPCKQPRNGITSWHRLPNIHTKIVLNSLQRSRNMPTVSALDRLDQDGLRMELDQDSQEESDDFDPNEQEDIWELECGPRPKGPRKPIPLQEAIKPECDVTGLSEKICVVCEKKKRGKSLFEDCGHITCCYTCTKDIYKSGIKECPTCKKPIAVVFKFFSFLRLQKCELWDATSDCWTTDTSIYFADWLLIWFTDYLKLIFLPDYFTLLIDNRFYSLIYGWSWSFDFYTFFLDQWPD